MPTDVAPLATARNKISPELQAETGNKKIS
jgi:hypothetical protein